MEKKQGYGCSDYRREMILVGLRRRLASPDLTRSEREALQAEIEKIEKEMCLT